MRTTSGARAAALLAAAVITCAGCGSTSTSTTNAPDKPASTPTHAGPDLPGGGAAPAIVVLRTGGIAGVHDMVAIAADGSARFTSNTRPGRRCTPSAASIARLRSVDLSAVGAPTIKPQLADMFSYSVQVGGRRAAASAGDATGHRADLVGAAAAVLASCQATQSGSPSAVSY